jgi:hypothetical protein
MDRRIRLRVSSAAFEVGGVTRWPRIYARRRSLVAKLVKFRPRGLKYPCRKSWRLPLPKQARAESLDGFRCDVKAKRRQRTTRAHYGD